MQIWNLWRFCIVSRPHPQRGMRRSGGFGIQDAQLSAWCQLQPDRGRENTPTPGISELGWALWRREGAVTAWTAELTPKLHITSSRTEAQGWGGKDQASRLTLGVGVSGEGRHEGWEVSGRMTQCNEFPPTGVLSCVTPDLQGFQCLSEY